MKKLILYILLITATACSSAESTESMQAVVFDTSIHCEDCVNTMFDNLPKEDGVVDLEVGLDEKTVTIVFDSAETSVENLANKINDLGYYAYVKNVSDYKKE